MNIQLPLKLEEVDYLSMRDRAKTFFWAAKFLPQKIRTDIDLLYTFCRYVDDSVDRCEDKLLATRAIDGIIEDLYLNRSRTKEIADFLRLAESRKIPLSFAIDLAEGVRSDLFEVKIESEDELIRYCYRVAATVGIMSCYMFDVIDPKAIAFGIDLGIAMQLTNIARDVFEDYASNRIYLPSSVVSSSTIEQAVRGYSAAQEELLLGVEHILELANVYYRSAENGMVYLPLKVRLGVMVASQAYREIGQMVIRQPQRYLRERIATTLTQKQMCLLRAIVSLSTKSKYWKFSNARSHQKDLHRVLRGLPSFDLVYS